MSWHGAGTIGDGPDVDGHEGETLDPSALAWLASKAMQREQRQALHIDASGRVRCPVCVGTGCGEAFLTECGCCEGRGRVPAAEAEEVRGAA